MVCHESLEDYYKTNFNLGKSTGKHNGYTLTELEAMLPWERDVYVNMLLQYAEEERQRIKQQNGQ